MIRASSRLRKPVILWMVLTICLILLSGCSPSLTTGGHSTPEIKALALDALGIKVYARGIDNVEVQGVIPLELPYH